MLSPQWQTQLQKPEAGLYWMKMLLPSGCYGTLAKGLLGVRCPI